MTAAAPGEGVKASCTAAGRTKHNVRVADTLADWPGSMMAWVRALDLLNHHVNSAMVRATPAMAMPTPPSSTVCLWSSARR